MPKKDLNDADGIRTRNLRIESPAICQLIYNAKTTMRWDGVEPPRREHLVYSQAGLPMPNHLD